MMIQVFRKGVGNIKLPLKGSVFTKKLQAEHTLAFTFDSAEAVDLAVGDTLTYKGELMTLNRAVNDAKVHSRLFRYEAIFEGVRHSLKRWILQDEGAVIFPYTADLETFMYMFVGSVNARDPEGGWSIGELEQVEPFTLSFRMTDHLAALNMIAQGAGCEWQMVGKQISVKKKVGQVSPISLSYGKDNGLYGLERKRIDDTGIVNFAYGIGGERNLPADYPFQQLMLEAPVQDPVSIDANGLREDFYENPDIYPKRTGTVSAIGQEDEMRFTVRDDTLDFDLEGQRISGTEAMLVFTSGPLNGQEFKIISYDHSTNEIRYEANKDPNGNIVPKGAYAAEVGDSYTLYGIRMPDTYRLAALAELQAETEAFVERNRVPRVVYELGIDILDAKRKAVYPNEGDYVHVSDASLGIDENVRVTAISHSGMFPDILEQGMEFTCELSRDLTYSLSQKIERDIRETKESVKKVSSTSRENDRRTILALNEFTRKVIDPDGKLEHALIEAIVGFFGAQSMIYDLEGVTYVENTGGDPNSFSISGGTIIHKVYEHAPDMYEWTLAGTSVQGLDPLKQYYVAARCSRTSGTGQWSVSETEMATDQDQGYWYFNLGILSSVIKGSRSFQSTKGYTIISGGEIITDSITAFHINVRKLFAQEVEAINMTVTGNSKIGPFSIDADGLYYYVAGSEQIRFRINRDGIQWINSQTFPGPVPKDSSIRIGLTSALVDILNEGNASRHTGIRIEMPDGASYRAIDVINGRSRFSDINLNGNVTIGEGTELRTGHTGTFEYNMGGAVYDLEFKNGILVRQGFVHD